MVIMYALFWYHIFANFICCMCVGRLTLWCVSSSKHQIEIIINVQISIRSVSDDLTTEPIELDIQKISSNTWHCIYLSALTCRTVFHYCMSHY